MEENRIIEYKIGLSPTRLTYLPEWYYKRQYSTIGELNRLQNLEDNKTKEVISRKTGMKIQRCVEWLSLASNYRSTYCKKSQKSYTHKLSMITLTIPECEIKPIISDVNRLCLVPFLKSMRKYYGLESYVWVAEYQENGMVHYHITTNTFLHKDIIKKVWNKLLNKNRLCEDYNTRENNRNPSSTRVEGIRDESRTARYLSKYMSKDSQQKESGYSRRWGASQSLTQSLKATIAISPQEFEYVDNNIKSLVSFANLQGSRGTYFMTYDFKPLSVIGSIGLAFRQWCHKIRTEQKDLFSAAHARHSKPPPAPPPQPQVQPARSRKASGQVALCLS